jgi:valine dehydrogenase (NAD+)
VPYNTFGAICATQPADSEVAKWADLSTGAPTVSTVDVFEAGHEQVLFCFDADSGLRCIIAVYSTALGPALGGTRLVPYVSTQAALDDVLALSRAMAYKNALAGLPHGGGKAVIIAEPADKTPDLLRAYGRAVDSLGGRYVTACDVGTYVTDMDVVAETTLHVTGRSPDKGGAGDSGVLTAFGVHQGMRACAQHRWGSPDLAGRRVGVSGLGKVGSRLVEHLLADGARVAVSDIDPRAVAEVTSRHPEVEVLGPSEMVAAPLAVYSPNALGGVIDAYAAATLGAEVVCGGANNPLTGPDAAAVLHERGITYAPDYLVNSGGVIQVSDELLGFDMQRARAKARGIFDTTLDVLTIASDEGISPLQAADRVAEQRMAAAGGRPG